MNSILPFASVVYVFVVLSGIVIATVASGTGLLFSSLTLHIVVFPTAISLGQTTINFNSGILGTHFSFLQVLPSWQSLSDIHSGLIMHFSFLQILSAEQSLSFTHSGLITHFSFLQILPSLQSLSFIHSGFLTQMLPLQISSAEQLLSVVHSRGFGQS